MTEIQCVKDKGDPKTKWQEAWRTETERKTLVNINTCFIFLTNILETNGTRGIIKVYTADAQGVQLCNVVPSYLRTRQHGSVCVWRVRLQLIPHQTSTRSHWPTLNITQCMNINRLKTPACTCNFTTCTTEYAKTACHRSVVCSSLSLYYRLSCTDSRGQKISGM